MGDRIVKSGSFQELNKSQASNLSSNTCFTLHQKLAARPTSAGRIGTFFSSQCFGIKRSLYYVNPGYKLHNYIGSKI